MFPRLSGLPPAIVLYTTSGLAYGLIFKTNLKIAVCAFDLSIVAHNFLFAVANPLFKGDCSARSLKVLIVTSSIVNVATIIAFRQLELIGTFGTVVMGIGSLLSFNFKYFILKKTQRMLQTQAAR